MIGPNLEGTYLAGCITDQGGKPWLCYDTGDNTTKENGSLCHDIQELLREHGWEMQSPDIEHDCISGFLIPYKATP